MVDLDLELEPLTCLIGPNGSGKSSVLRALGDATKFTERDVFRRETSRSVYVSWEWSGGRATRTLDFKGTHSKEGEPPIQRLVHYDVERLRRANSLYVTNQLDPDGGNLTAVFDNLPRKSQAALAKTLCSLVPLYQDVDRRPVDASHTQEILFQDRWDDSVWYRPTEVSDGTMLLLAYLILGHESEPPDILAIEEPERGLHPYLLGELVSFLRALATGQIDGREMTIVMATHSAELLDHLRPEEVRFLSKDEEGRTVVDQVSSLDPEWQTSFGRYRESLGEMWLSGGLGAVPGG